METIALDVLPDEKSEPAYDDQEGDGQADDRVARIGGEGRIFARFIAHQVETRVAEGGNGGENSHPDPVAPAVIGYESETQHERAERFEDERTEEDGRGEFAHPGDRRRADRFLHECALFYADLFSAQFPDGVDDGHKPDTADLDEQKNDDLPVNRPMCGSVLDDQPRHAGSGNGGKERVHKGCGTCDLGRKGQDQQDRSDDDDA